MNVLSDSLMYAVYTGMEAGLVVVTADDPGMFSSQNEQDNRWYARLAKIPMLEPADSQEAKDYVILAVELSEKFDTPILIRTVMRTSHSKSVVTIGSRPNGKAEIGPFKRDPAKYNCTASNARKMHPRVEQRIKEIGEYADGLSINRIEWRDRSLGFITGGVLYHYLLDVFPGASILKLGMTYPLPETLIREFAGGVEQLVVLEELDPVIEEQVKAMGIEVRGKDIFPPCFELLPDEIKRYTRDAGLLKETVPSRKEKSGKAEKLPELPIRSPVFCAGCPHRSPFYLLKKMKLPVAGDIGCYNLGTLPPFDCDPDGQQCHRHDRAPGSSGGGLGGHRGEARQESGSGSGSSGHRDRKGRGGGCLQDQGGRGKAQGLSGFRWAFGSDHPGRVHLRFPESSRALPRGSGEVHRLSHVLSGRLPGDRAVYGEEPEE